MVSLASLERLERTDSPDCQVVNPSHICHTATLQERRATQAFLDRLESPEHPARTASRDRLASLATRARLDCLESLASQASTDSPEQRASLDTLASPACLEFLARRA